MAKDDNITLRFECGGVELKISGKHEFVQKMYRTMMEDVEEARKRAEDEAHQTTVPEPPEGKRPSAWLHRCGAMMHKIYMVTNEDLESTLLDGFVDVVELSAIYVEDEVFDQVIGQVERGDTLWAEFTNLGRRKMKEIEDLSSPIREALTTPVPGD